MALTQWDSTYELGVPEIDDHHQKLVHLLNKTYELLLYSIDKAEIKTILQELINYTDYHFAAEEQLMKEVSYKGLIPHVTKHNNFKKQLSDLMQNYLSGEPYVNTDIVLFLSEWLRKHILKDDRKLTTYLSKSKSYSIAV